MLIWQVYELPTLEPDYLQHFRSAWRGRRVHGKVMNTHGSAPNHRRLEPSLSQSTNMVAPPWDGDRFCLAVAYCINRSSETAEASPDDDTAGDGASSDRWRDFAWRLERHWLVEWSDVREAPSSRTDRPKTRPDGTLHPPGFHEDRHAIDIARAVAESTCNELPRPPVALILAEGAILIGADLPPRLRPALGALVSFAMVSADELRAAFTIAEEPVPSASDLSRTLSYLESSGFLSPLSQEDTEAYREARALGRRPLKVYSSPAFFINRRARALVESREAVPATSEGDRPFLYSDGVPTDAARLLLTAWLNQRMELRERGLTTV